MKPFIRKTLVPFGLIVATSLLWSCASEESVSEADLQPPLVSKVYPEEGSTAVEITTNPKVIFTEPLDNSSMTGGADGSCVGTVQFSAETGNCLTTKLVISGTTLTIYPVDNLSFSTEYTIRLTKNIKDLAGNNLPDDFESKFTTADNIAGLGDSISARLDANLMELSIFSKAQTSLIITNAENQLVLDKLEHVEDPSLVLPSYLSGSLNGIGKVNTSAENRLKIINSTVSTIVTLIGEFEDKLTSSKLDRTVSEQIVFEELLGNLVQIAIISLPNTGLDSSSLNEGFGEIVVATITSLDAAKVAGTEEFRSAIEVVTRKSVQQAAIVAKNKELSFESALIQIVEKTVIAIQKLPQDSATKESWTQATEDQIGEEIEVIAESDPALVPNAEALKNSVSTAIVQGGTSQDTTTETEETDDGAPDETGDDTAGTTPDNDPIDLGTIDFGDQECSLNGETIAHGVSVVTFASSSVAIGSSCQSETRTCSNGTLSGTFTHENCTVESPAMSGSVQTFGSGASSRMISRSSAATAPTTVSITGVKSLVTLYLLIDDQFKYPIAKIKTAADGTYDVIPSDITSFLLNPPATGLEADHDFFLPTEAAITSSSTDAEIILAFQALGPLQLRALYVKDGKPKVINAMADPSSTEPVRVDPMVSRAAQQLIGSLQKTIKTSLEAGATLTDQQKKDLLAGVLVAVKETVNNTLAEVETTFELPEGVTDASELESFLEVEIDATTLNAIESALDNDDANLDDLADDAMAVEDSGKLGDTLSDEQKGSLAKLAEEASSTATNSVTGLDATVLKQIANKVQAEGLRKFFLDLGFPVVLAEGSYNTSVVAIPLKVPPTVEDSDLPGAATFGDRSIRHFLVKENANSAAPNNWGNAPVLADQVDQLKNDLDGYIDQQGVVEEAKLIAEDKKHLVDRVRVFHRFERALTEGMPLVSKELVDWMVEYDKKTVTVQDVATQVAKITKWRQERIVFANGLPVFTGDYSAPSTGGTVKASALITALTNPLGTDAKTTAAELTDGNKNFWVPFAAEALKEQIMRNADSLEFDALLPASENDYKQFLKGLAYDTFSGSTNQVPPSPAYTDARATIARGLVAALPDNAYSTTSQKKTINGQTQLNAKQAIFVITYLLELQFAVEKAQGLLITEDDGKLFPNIENFKSLSFTSDVGVAEVAAQMMAVTGPSEGEGFNFAQSQLRSGGLLTGVSATTGLAGMMLPEFKEFNAEEIGIEQKTEVSVSCNVKMFDGLNPSDLSVQLLQFEQATEEFSNTGIAFSTTGNLSFIANNVPTQQEYVIRFKIDSYRNDLPELFFWADEFSEMIDPCGENFVIGPDVEDKPLPGAALFAASSKVDAEGLDFSNYSEPGKLFLLFPDEEPAEGLRDLMLISTGNTYRLELNTGMAIATVRNSDSTLSFSIGEEIRGIRSLLGQSLSSVLGSNFIGSSSITLQPDEYGGLGEQVFLIKISEKEYWLLETHYLDTQIGILELAFAKVSPQGRAEIPEAGFEQGPVDLEKAGEIENFYLGYGDGLCLGSACTNRQEFAFGYEGDVADIDASVNLRYAGDDFFENIESIDDLVAFYEDGDASAIPVRLDGRGSTNFVKLSFDKQKRKYTMSSTSSSATGLQHNDLIGVCLSGVWENSGCPNYILRVVRFASEKDLLANLSLELQAVEFTEPGPGEDYRKAVIGSAVNGVSYPELSMSDEQGQVVFDGDFDGVPWLFDPNDEDPNIPGSSVGREDDSGMGLAIQLVNKYTYSDLDEDGVADEGGSVLIKNGEAQYTSRLLLETNEIYLGVVDQITLTNEELGMNGTVLASCQPPSQDVDQFIEATCTITEESTDSLKVAPSLAYQSYEGLGVFLAPKSSVLTALQGKHLNYRITFRKPQDFLTGEPLMCGENECPARPPEEGSVRIRIPVTPVGPFENVKITSGSSSAQQQAEVSSVDTSKSLKLSASSVSLAREYALDISCEGFENTQENYFEPPFSNTWVLPPSTATPSFLIEPGMIPSGGGRACQFRMIASGEDADGNPIGATLHSFELSLTGGFTGAGGFVDNSLKISSAAEICLRDDGLLEVRDCDEPLITATVQDGLLSVMNGSGTVEVGNQIRTLAEGTLNGTLYLEENCGYLEGDQFREAFECETATGTSLLNFSNGQLSSSLNFQDFDGNPINLAELSVGYHELIYQTGQIQYRVSLDIHDSGQALGAFVFLQKEEPSSLSALTNGGRFFINAGGGQSYEMEVRFVKGTEAKLEFFMPPPRYSLSVGTLELGGIVVGEVVFNNNIFTLSPGQNISFKDPSTQQTRNSFTIDTSLDQHYFELLVSDGDQGRKIRILFEKENTEISVEWFEDYANFEDGGGASLFEGTLSIGEFLCFNPNTFNFFASDQCSAEADAVLSVDQNDISLSSGWNEADFTSCDLGSLCKIEDDVFGGKFDLNIGVFDEEGVYIQLLPYTQEIVAEPAYNVENFGIVAQGNTVLTSWNLFTTLEGQAPHGFLLLCSDHENLSAPVDYVTYDNDDQCSDGTGAVHLLADQTEFTWTNLAPDQTYFFAIYAYTNAAENIDYITPRITLRAYELDDSADQITYEEKKAGSFEQINDATITERGWEMTDTGSTYTVEVGVPCFSWSRSTQGHPEQDGLAENLDSHDHFNAADETYYVDGIYSWTEYGPEHSQAEIDETCEAGIEGVSKTANIDNYTADVTIYLKVEDLTGTPQTISITTPSDNHPPETFEVDLDVEVGETVTESLASYQAAFDQDGDGLTYTFAQTSARGVAITVNNVTTGNFTYIAPDTPGLDNFTFFVEDDKGAVSNTSMVILNVVQNPQPTARTICERPFADSTLSPQLRYSVDNHTGSGSNITFQPVISEKVKFDVKVNGTGFEVALGDPDNSTGANYLAYWNSEGSYTFGLNQSESDFNIGVPPEPEMDIELKDNTSKVLGRLYDNITVVSSISPEPPLEAWVEPGNDNVTLRWCGDPSKKYELIDNSSGTFQASEVTGDNYTFTGLNNGTNYEFTVRSKNAAGLRSHSTVPVQAIPHASPTLDMWIDNITINQAVQVPLDSNSINTPLIAHKAGRLRVFVGLSGNANGVLSKVRLEGTRSGIPLPVQEAEFSLRKTSKNKAEEYYHPVDFELTHEHLQPGNTTFTITLDPDNQTIESAGNKSNNMASRTVQFENASTLKIRFVPVKVDGQDNTVLQKVLDETDNKTLNSLKDYFLAMYPNATIDASFANTIGNTEAFIVDGSSDDQQADNYTLALSDVELFKELESNDNKTFYYGLWTGGSASFVNGIAGVANNPDNASTILNHLDVGGAPWAGIGVVFQDQLLTTTAHEIGHMASLQHVICDNETNDFSAGPVDYADDFYPYNGTTDNTTGGGDDFGRIGKVGYDFRNGGEYLSKTLYHDIMSYCSRVWISDYHYNKLYDFQKDLNTTFPTPTARIARRSNNNESYVLKVGGLETVAADLPNESTYFNGVLRQDGKIQILNTALLAKRANVAASGEFEYLVEAVSGKAYRGYFSTIRISHVKSRSFSFSIPTQEALRSLQIFRAIDDQEVFRQEFASTAKARTAPIQLERISDREWRIPATNKGRRVVRRIQPTKELLVFDLDRSDKVIKGSSGDQIEIQYLIPGQPEKQVFELR